MHSSIFKSSQTWQQLHIINSDLQLQLFLPGLWIICIFNMLLEVSDILLYPVNERFLCWLRAHLEPPWNSKLRERNNWRLKTPRLFETAEHSSNSWLKSFMLVICTFKGHHTRTISFQRIQTLRAVDCKLKRCTVDPARQNDNFCSVMVFPLHYYNIDCQPNWSIRLFLWCTA